MRVVDNFTTKLIPLKGFWREQFYPLTLLSNRVYSSEPWIEEPRENNLFSFTPQRWYYDHDAGQYLWELYRSHKISVNLVAGGKI